MVNAIMSISLIEVLSLYEAKFNCKVNYNRTMIHAQCLSNSKKAKYTNIKAPKRLKAILQVF